MRALYECFPTPQWAQEWPSIPRDIVQQRNPPSQVNGRWADLEQSSPFLVPRLDHWNGEAGHEPHEIYGNDEVDVSIFDGGQFNKIMILDSTKKITEASTLDHSTPNYA